MAIRSKRICAIVALAMSLASLPSPAVAWGARGHYEVGAVADRILRDHPRARQAVRELIGMRLAQAGPWADCVRAVSRSGSSFRYTSSDRWECQDFQNPEGIAFMEDYVRRNWSTCPQPRNAGCHTQYHFIDLALERDGHAEGLVGTFDYDIVRALNAAITVLQGNPSPAPFNFTRRDALILLAHFVGDLHQPLHVGSVYLDDAGTRVDPDSSEAERARVDDTSTHGGNALVWPDPENSERTFNLHSMWDSVRTGNYSLADARQTPATAGPVGSWAAQWATESLLAARQAFDGITFADRPGHEWLVTFANRAAYDTSREILQRQRIERAGARLAAVLVAIWPDE